MKIERTDFDELNAQLQVIIEPEDYLDRFKDELKKYKSKAHLKGFRKGKTPMSSLKKMYGFLASGRESGPISLMVFAR